MIDRLPKPIELLSDNGSPYIARETRALAREIGLVLRTTPIESPQSTDVIDKQFLCSAEASRFPVPACHFGWRRAQRVVKTGRSPPPQAAWS